MDGMQPRVLWMSLRSRGVRFVLDGDAFRIRAPKDVLTLADKQQLREHREAITAIVRESCQVCESPLYFDDSLTVRLCINCRGRIATNSDNVAANAERLMKVT